MNFVSVMFASPVYDELVQIRLQSLYIPLEAEINIEAFAQEYKDVHLAVYDVKSQLIGAVVAKVCEEEDEFMNKRKICLLKQVVVKPKLQRLGLGKELMANLEQLLISKGYKEIRLYAHIGAMDYYGKMGFVKHGKPFSGAGIKQHTLKKKIQKKSDKLHRLEAVGYES